MQEYRITANDNKSAIGILPQLADNHKAGGLQIRILKEKKYFGKGKSQNEELFGIDWNGDLDCASLVIGADIMEVVEVLRGRAKSLRGNKGIDMNPAIANANTKLSSEKDGSVKFFVTRIIAREVPPSEEEMKAYKAAVKAAKGKAKGDANNPEPPKAKRETVTFSGAFTLTKYQAEAVAASLA